MMDLERRFLEGKADGTLPADLGWAEFKLRRADAGAALERSTPRWLPVPLPPAILHLLPTWWRARRLARLIRRLEIPEP